VLALGSDAYATFGLSRHALTLGDETVAQELVLSADDPDWAVSVLTALGMWMLERRRGIGEGERHGFAPSPGSPGILGVQAVSDPSLPPSAAGVRFVRLRPVEG
jgi:hypothetical protein